jgi:hypothetical protein
MRAVARLTTYERETIINWNQAEGLARVFTYDKALINSMRKNPAARELRSEPAGGVEFQIPKKLIGIRRPRRPSAADPSVMADRMAKMRDARCKQ